MMDFLMILAHTGGMDEMPAFRKPEGFPGQVHYVIPDDVMASVARNPLARPLHLSAAGYFPAARYHYVRRREGIRDHILILCVEGRGWYETGTGRFALPTGSFCIIPDSIPHAYGASPDSPWTIFWAHFSGESVPFYLAPASEGESGFTVAPGVVGEVRGIFDRIFRFLDHGYTERGIVASSIAFADILATLFVAAEGTRGNLGSELSRRMEETIGFMLDHIGERPSLADMAAVAKLSVPHYSALFRNSTGYPPVEYFIRIKMQKACAFLDLSDLKISAIASALGYDDPFYFSRIFTRIMGCSPQAYRRRTEPGKAPRGC
jgi:AraC-like DNA-binding protein